MFHTDFATILELIIQNKHIKTDEGEDLNSCEVVCLGDTEGIAVVA